MMARASLIFLFASFFSFTIFSQSKCSSNCGALVKSPCTDQGTSKWNKHNVAHELKSWVTQLKKLTSVKQTEVKHFFLRKNVYLDPKINIVRYIGNVNCSSKNTFGPIWKTGGRTSNHQFHDGFLYGHEDEKGTLTGDNIVFLYPDMETALVGQFKNDSMVAAKPAKVIAERCNQGIKEIKVALPTSARTPILKYVRPNHIRIGDQPTIMDPFERKYVFIADGKKEDGVFAKKYINKGDIIMYYSGIILNQTEVPLWSSNTTWEERWPGHRNLMSLQRNIHMNVPEPYWDISKYRATLGHKVNHSFKFDNAAFGRAYHPRFGNIRTVYATAGITKGEEILVNYGYPKGGPVPEWYAMLYLDEIGANWYSTNQNVHRSQSRGCRNNNQNAQRSQSCGCRK